MKSIELGDYDTFSGLLSLFTAVIGLAYPFILQAIERIQERYITERVSHWFEGRRAYNADITYGTNNEFGFDYLRDNYHGSL